MTLYFIGLGIHCHKDIPLEGLELVKECDKVYLESYTSKLDADLPEIEKLYGKKIILADRSMVESDDNQIIKDAKDGHVAFLVIGDPMAATTHADLMLRAKKEGIKTYVTHASSVFSAVAVTGLQLYKFGKTASIPFWQKSFEPEAFFNIFLDNQKIGAHTLFLLDLDPESDRYMTVNKALEMLLEVARRRKNRKLNKRSSCIGVGQLGCHEPEIVSGSIEDVAKHEFQKFPQSLIIPGKLHFVEEEMLDLWSVK